MTKKINLAAPAIAALAALAAVCGCNRGPSLAEIEDRERASRLYSTAMDDLQAGRTDAAIKGFTRVVYQEPQSYSAHFQLATLLQDVRKDYIGAIAHYRAYLDLRPAADKATVAQDRMKSCHALLSAEFLRKTQTTGAKQLADELAKLKDQNAKLAAELAQTRAELETAAKTAARLETESAMHKRIIAKLDLDDDGKPGATQSAKEALAELKKMEAEERRRRVTPTDAELLDEDDAPENRIASSAEYKDLKTKLAADESKPAAAPFDETASSQGPRAGAFENLISGRNKPATPARPETYTVQEGDTLLKISRKFYGNSRKWRDIQSLNKDTIPHDGRLKAGQTIKLP